MKQDRLVEKSIATLRALMPDMTSEERHLVMKQISEGYCPRCGNKETTYYCPCENDE